MAKEKQASREELAASGYRFSEADFNTKHPADSIEDAAPELREVVKPEAGRKAAVGPAENKSK